MQFKPPLTRDDLVAIQERNPGNTDVRSLFWEAKRLRAFALYVDQLQRIVVTLPSQQSDALESNRRQLEDELCIKEFPRLPLGA